MRAVRNPALKAPCFLDAQTNGIRRVNSWKRSPQIKGAKWLILMDIVK